MREIFLNITNEYIKQSSRFGGVQGAGNVTALILNFDESWDGFAKTLTWFNAEGRDPVHQVLTLDKALDQSYRIYRVNIPKEPLALWGACNLGIEGYKDSAIAKSITVEFEVEPCLDTAEAVESQDPSPTIAQQLQEEIEGIKYGITRAVDNSAQALDLSEKNASDIEVLKQSGGSKGEAGEDGFSPIANVTQTSTGATITITDKSGTTTATVTNGTNGSNGANGKDGEDGKDGKDGRGIKSVARTSGNGSAGTTDTYTITYTDNTTSTFTVYNGANGKTPVKGTDYFTTADINEIVNAVYAKIADGNGVAY